ncbi:tRNA modification GTPase MnmE [Campylobacter majalis]|uniref:tRNA modification GTPase MnmE n=1 Tax=Campylobacter majalis TaxID=2790656 RepID=A0ABM8Q425_9BACT|nr:[FeFe] hydrogenase H-cluster maturation GTPase HydF [Campylobacter majalis]CAD7287524.1 tRNA modification GTPase MnmE [Campylobacter majalis]
MSAKFLRTRIGLFGRTNVGKSSIMNMLANQDVSIVSDVSGTTTDIVEKPIEIHGLGAVLLIDTAGIDDKSLLGQERIKRTKDTLKSVDIAIIVCENGVFDKEEKDLIAELKFNKKPYFLLINKCDLSQIKDEFLDTISGENFILTSTKTALNLDEIYKKMIEISSKLNLNSNDLFFEILDQDKVVILVTPIDDEAPKDRLILPQVQAIRQILDKDCSVVVTKSSDVSQICRKFNPDLIVCDSQCVLEVVKSAPSNISITTFSILFSRLKGDLNEFVKGANAIRNLKNEDTILIAEGCTHNAKDGDIARVKIPNLLKKVTQKELKFVHTNGKDFPDDLNKYALIIHCGGCMIHKNFIINRINEAKKSGISITNYGIAISFCQGVLDRVIKIFY